MTRRKPQRTASSIPERSGFVLLVVLATLVVAGVTLASLANASLQRVFDAQSAQEELQRRWGTVSLERALLPRAMELFDDHDERRRSGDAASLIAGTIPDQIVLGSQRFDLILADEDAKANLNALYHEARQPHVERTLRQLTGPAGQLVTRLTTRTPSAAQLNRVRARRDDDGEAAEPIPPPAFTTWADVFDIARLRQTTGDDRMLATFTGQVTLWGSGRLNVERASDEAVLAVFGAVVPDGLARRLLRSYRERPEVELPLMLEKGVSGGEDRERLLKLVREGSSTYSLWTEVTSRRSRQQRFSVIQPSPEGQLKTFEFTL